LAIQVDNIGTVSLGSGSAPQVSDNYVRPVMPTQDDSLNQLANSLSKLGVSFDNVGQQNQQTKEQMDMAKVDHTIMQIKNDQGSSTVHDAQIGALYPEMSPTVRARISEGLGMDAAKQFMTSQFEELNKNPEVQRDPVLLEQKLKEIEAQAAQTTHDDPLWGSGYARTVKSGIDSIRQSGLQERSKFYDQIQLEQIDNAAEAAHQAQKKGALPAFVAASPSANKVMDLDMSRLTKPMSLAATLIGYDERKNAKTIASFIEKGTGKNLNPEDVPWCAAFVDAALNQAGMKGLGSWRAADWKNFGKGVDKPEMGDVVVFNPGTAQGSSGHVGFYHSTNPDGSINVLSGNSGQGGGSTGRVTMQRYDAGRVAAYRRPTDLKTAAQAEDKGGTVDDFVNTVSRIESSGDPNAKNGNAVGLGGFMPQTVAGLARKYMPESVATLSDEQIADKRSDPEFSKSMIKAYAEENSKLFQKEGVEVNNANLYLGHFLDGKWAAKLLKAKDSALVEQVLPEEFVEKNKSVLEGRTVGEVKEWAARKVGSSVDPVTARQNEVRSADRVFGKSMSINDTVRRDRFADYYKKQAVATLDPSYLDSMPKDWLTPRIQAEYDETRTNILKAQVTLHSEQIRLQNEQRQEMERKAIDDINGRFATGQKINPTDYVKYGDKAYSHALERTNSEALINPKESQALADSFSRSVELATQTGKWDNVSPMFKDKQPSVAEVEDVLRKRTDMKAADVTEVMKKLPNIINSASVATSEDAKGFWSRRMQSTLDLMGKDMQAQLIQKFGPLAFGMDAPDFEGEARGVFEDSITRQTKAFAESGAMPTQAERNGIFTNAMKEAKDHLKEMREHMQSVFNGGGDGGSKGSGSGGKKDDPKSTTVPNPFVPENTPQANWTPPKDPAPKGQKWAPSPVPGLSVLVPDDGKGTPAVPAKEAPKAEPAPTAGETRRKAAANFGEKPAAKSEGVQVASAVPTPIPAPEPVKEAPKAHDPLEAIQPPTSASQKEIDRSLSSSAMEHAIGTASRGSITNLFPVLKDIMQNRDTATRQHVEMAQPLFEADEHWQFMKRRIDRAPDHHERSYREEELKKYEEQFAEKLYEQLNASGM
jgi:uncharacterized protein (TIGR02594 family)